MSDHEAKIRIQLVRTTFTRSAKAPASGKVMYHASIDGMVKSFGPMKFRKAGLHALDWSVDVNVKNKKKVEVRVRCEDADPQNSKEIGTVQYLLKAPFTQGWRCTREKKGKFLLEFSVALFTRGKFGPHTPDTVFACRQNTNSATATTVSGKKHLVRLEFHPVCPTPTKGLPNRPWLGLKAWLSGKNIQKNDLRAAVITPTSPMNIIKNPTVIPILTPPLPARAGKVRTDEELDAAGYVNNRNAARIEYTWYYPASMNFTDDDDRLEWKVTPLSGSPSVKFLGKPNGTKVQVYGSGNEEGAVLLEVWLKDVKLAVYRALVQKIKKVKCRFNILKNRSSNDPDDSPASDLAAVKRHFQMMNRLLRQCGVEMEYDDSQDLGLDMTGSNKKFYAKDGTELQADLKCETKILDTGVFEIKAKQGMTYDASDSRQNKAAKINARENIVNLTYIHSCDEEGTLGAMIWYKRNPAASPYNEAGNPSSSWKKKSGVQYVKKNKAAQCDPVNMTVGTGSQPSGQTDIYGIYIVDREHDSDSEFANTIAHEFGHVIGLDHRQKAGQGDWPDGVGYPFEENLMHFDNPATIAQDIDMVQTKVMHESPIIQ